MFYNKITDHERLMKGDVIVIPKSKAKALALSPNALSKHGVSIGFTGRADNFAETVRDRYTEVLAAGEAVAYVVVNIHQRHYWNDTAVKFGRYFGNAAKKDVSDVIPRFYKAELRRISIPAVAGGRILTKWDAVSAFRICDDKPDNPRLKAAFDAMAPIEWSDIYSDAYGGRDHVHDKMMEILRKSAALNEGEIPSGGNGAGTLTADGFTSCIVEKMLDIRGHESIVVSRKTVNMFARKGVRFLRPTDAARDAIAARVGEWLSSATSEAWTGRKADLEKALALAEREPGRIAARAKSWKNKSRALARKANAVTGRKGRMARELIKETM